MRSAGSSSKIPVSTLKELMNDVTRNSKREAIRVFRREKLDTDICIVLFHNEKKSKIGGSPLGLRLVAALKEFGLVHHTVWSEC